ncbi:MAG: ORC1-type DNA replication protein 2 [Euryarchaeota archaeon ADurb.BinA087]|nr:MAG: ORC1-type DNA replication protein 2 [Euryarchaeota archaeon ADurb.BinA087]
MDVDLSQAVDARVSSVFRPSEVYFPPYSEDEVREIVRERVLQGLYPGCLPEEMFSLVVEQTQKSGDLRVGIDLLKRATLNAERRASRVIERDDICQAYDVSKYLHLSFSVKSLKDEEKGVLRALANHSTGDSEMNAGEVFRAVKETVPIGYTRYYEIIRKFDAMRLINLHYRDGKGRTRVISLRYDPAKIINYLG